jgi:hypothetical protein
MGQCQCCSPKVEEAKSAELDQQFLPVVADDEEAVAFNGQVKAIQEDDAAVSLKDTFPPVKNADLVVVEEPEVAQTLSKNSGTAFAERETLVVSLRNSTAAGDFGLEVDVDDEGDALVINAIEAGQLRNWNSSQPEKLRASVGNRIVKVNSKSGRAYELLQWLKTENAIEMEIKQHMEFSASVQKNSSQRLGFATRFREGGYTLLIKAVSSGDFIIDRWNASNDPKILAGDRIVEVNGTRGYGSELDALLKKGGQLNLVLARSTD